MKITLIGAGKMGQAMLEAWHQHYFLNDHEVTVSSPNLTVLEQLKARYRITITHDNTTSVHSAEGVILAVRPTQLQQVALDIRAQLKPDTWLISCAAVGDLKYLSHHFGVRPMARILPTSALRHSLGLYAYCKLNSGLRYKETMDLCLDPFGQRLQLHESQFDAFIAASASGIAYVYALMNVYEQSVIDLGLGTDVAHLIVQQTFLAAATLAKDAPYPALIHAVKTPSGTTEAGLNALNETLLKEHFDMVFEATLKRIEQFEDALTV